MDKLDGLRIFSMIARYGSFAEAARHLSISRAMASKHISRLEDRLGVRLLHRSTRKLNLTEAGVAYLERVNNLLADLDDADAAVSELHSKPRGTLKIVSPPSFGAFHLARTVVAYQQAYPEVKIDLTLADRDPDLLEEGMDMAIQLGNLSDSSLVIRQLARSRMVVCAAPDYLKRCGTPKHPQDLLTHHCLLYAPRSNLRQWELTIDGASSYPEINTHFRTNQADAVRIAALEGSGLAQLPTYIVGLDIRAGRLQSVMEDFEPTPLNIYASYPHRRHLSAKVRTFTDFAHRSFQPIPYWEKWTDVRDKWMIMI